MNEDSSEVYHELGKHFTVSRLQGDGESYMLERETPAHRFMTLLAPLRGGPSFLAITARDTFDEELARGLSGFIQKHAERLEPSRASVVLEGLQVPDRAFDTALVLSPQTHERFKVEAPALHARTWEAIPIYRCEFSGQEDAKLIQLLRSKFVSTIDWKREPAPQVWMKYNNLRTQARSRGRQPVLASLRMLKHELKELPNSPGSFIEVKNFLGERCKLVSEGEGVAIESPLLPTPIRVPPQAPLDSWMEAFVTVGGQRLKEVLAR